MVQNIDNSDMLDQLATRHRIIDSKRRQLPAHNRLGVIISAASSHSVMTMEQINVFIRNVPQTGTQDAQVENLKITCLNFSQPSAYRQTAAIRPTVGPSLCRSPRPRR